MVGNGRTTRAEIAIPTSPTGGVLEVSSRSKGWSGPGAMHRFSGTKPIFIEKKGDDGFGFGNEPNFVYSLRESRPGEAGTQ